MSVMLINLNDPIIAQFVKNVFYVWIIIAVEIYIIYIIILFYSLDQ